MIPTDNKKIGLYIIIGSLFLILFSLALFQMLIVTKTSTKSQFKKSQAVPVQNSNQSVRVPTEIPQKKESTAPAVIYSYPTQSISIESETIPTPTSFTQPTQKITSPTPTPIPTVNLRSASTSSITPFIDSHGK